MAEVRIYDDQGRQLGPGQVGNVYLKLMGDFGIQELVRTGKILLVRGARAT